MREPENGGRKAKGIDTVIWGLAAIAAVAILLVTVAVHLTRDPWMQVVSSFVTFYGSVYLSFVVTRHYARVASREELRRLAEAAGSRIFLLSLQMRQLASELADSEAADKVTKVVVNSIAAQIDRLAAQADLSVEDLERIADIDLPLPAMRSAAQTRVEAATKLEKINCPHCGSELEVTVSTAGGTTRHGLCSTCKQGFVVHRLGDGTVKVGYTEYFRIQCPNPSCQNEIGIRPRETEWGIIIRNCFECFARVHYDLDQRKVSKFERETPLTVAEDKVETTNGQRRVLCPSCSYVLTLQGYKNSRGQELMSCPRCTRLVAVQTEAVG
jgi:DNA-directed RNA polymerase subunit RPC12/RpoP